MFLCREGRETFLTIELVFPRIMYSVVRKCLPDLFRPSFHNKTDLSSPALG